MTQAFSPARLVDRAACFDQRLDQIDHPRSDEFHSQVDGIAPIEVDGRYIRTVMPQKLEKLAGQSPAAQHLMHQLGGIRQWSVVERRTVQQDIDAIRVD